jgi:hypothetical protein
MKLITAGLTSTVLAIGLVGSLAAYRSQVGEIESVERSTAGPPRVGGGVEQPRTEVRWAPCRDGSRLERGVCVTDVVRTVVLPAPAPSPAPSNASLTGVGTGADGDEDDSARADDHEDWEHGEHAHDGDDEHDHEDAGHGDD